MAAQFQFVMRAGPTIGKVYPLESPEISIGRETTNTIPINDVEVSRKHARMELRGPSYVIQDLGSTNGTFVNGQRITGVQVLNPGDSISFGEGIILTYESAFDPNATILSSRAARPDIVPPTQVAPQPIAPQPITPQPMAPVQAQVPAPVPMQMEPEPMYSGQVPAGPVEPMPAATRRKFPIWVIIVILALVVICGCIAFFVIVDQLNLWCSIVPFLVPLLGGSCG
jgi:predicted component of type VI protein secretion system